MYTSYNGKSNVYYGKSKIQLSCYMLLGVPCFAIFRHISCFLPKKIKQNSFETKKRY